MHRFRRTAALALALLIAHAAQPARAATEIMAPGGAPASFPPAADAPLLLWLWVLFIGLCLGSFLNVVIHRLPIMERREALAWAEAIQADEATRTDGEAPSGPEDAEAEAVPPAPYNLMVPRSACPHCGHGITALENIPVLSWLALRGRCSACGAPISARYPIVEAVTALLTVLVVLAFGFTGAGVLAALFTWALIALTMIDVDHMELPDAIVYPLLWLGLLANVGGLYVPLSQAVVGAAVGYLFLWSLYWAFRLFTGKEGMGYGDFKLMAAMGAWMGWAALPGLLLLSSLSGLLAFALMRVSGRLESGAPMPFGPAIALAGWLALVLPAFGFRLPGMP
ncbi:MAG: A24 family peptidase [Pseudomonadales bacterium]|nr:A24 family peptidase [Pseudomonadales bacterium]